jgi:hypothetical protein
MGQVHDGGPDAHIRSEAEAAAPLRADDRFRRIAILGSDPTLRCPFDGKR